MRILIYIKKKLNAKGSRLNNSLINCLESIFILIKRHYDVKLPIVSEYCLKHLKTWFPNYNFNIKIIIVNYSLNYFKILKIVVTNYDFYDLDLI